MQQKIGESRKGLGVGVEWGRNVKEFEGWRQDRVGHWWSGRVPCYWASRLPKLGAVGGREISTQDSGYIIVNKITTFRKTTPLLS